MTRIDRRRILASLAAGAAAVGSTDALARETETGTFRKRSDVRHGWLLARQRGEPGAEELVDFWSMPWLEISYPDFLPPQIVRGLVSHECFLAPRDPARNALGRDKGNYDKSEGFDGWFEVGKLDRMLADPDGINLLPPMLASFMDGSKARTALLAIDSACSGNRQWPEILPTFASHYHSMIAITHFAHRGLCQARTHFSRNFPKGHFERAFLQPAALCDAVVVTSEGLIETDSGLSARGSIENLVGEVARRLGYALLNAGVVARIIGKDRKILQKPRFFALGSATVNAPKPLSCLQSILERQSAFVSASFGPLTGLPLFIVTARERGPDMPIGILPTGLIDVFNRLHGAPIEPVAADEVQAAYYRADARDWPGALDLIALWPFNASSITQ